MLVLVIMVVVSVAAREGDQRDPATNQILYFKNDTEGPVGVITTSNGAPVSYPEATSTLNMRLIDNEFFMDAITHVTRKNILDRIVHAKGTGAFGYFQVTHDISHICKANFLKKVGKKTPVAVRFSTAIGERGAPDFASIDIRGFAVKFYTEDGIFDLTGLNSPMFFTNEPLHFPNFIHAFRRNPATNLFDSNSFWDMLSLIPESLFFFLFIFADRATPASYRNMPGFSLHTFQVVNNYGDRHFIRFHILPDDGIKNFNIQQARNITAMDPEHLTRDLFKAIGNDDFPSWTVNIQILTESDIKKIGPRVFDVTRVIPLTEYPLHQIGKLVLNRNCKNFFADIEQMAFCPSNLVNGISGGPDKLYESRRLAYRDAQLHRLGANFMNIPVNCPFQVKIFNYNRDGSPPVNDNGEDIPNYYPNSFHGPVPYIEKRKSELIDVIEKRSYNFDQAGAFYVDELTSDERTRLIENLVFSLQGVSEYIVERAIIQLTAIHPNLGNRVAQAMSATTQ